MQTSTVPLIPKAQIRNDADATSLINSDGYILNSVHSPSFQPVTAAQEVIGKSIFELYQPVPREFLNCLQRTFNGEAHWAAITFPTATENGPVDRRFVVEFLPWIDIDGRDVALTRIKLLNEDLVDAVERSGQNARGFHERANCLIAGELRLGNAYIDKLCDATRHENGFDASILLDEDGVILDILDMTPDQAPAAEGVNFVEFISFFDPSFQKRWQFMLEKWQYVSGIEKVPLPDGTELRLLSRVRVTKIRTPEGKRVVQIFVKRI